MRPKNNQKGYSNEITKCPCPSREAGRRSALVTKTKMTNDIRKTINENDLRSHHAVILSGRSD